MMLIYYVRTHRMAVDIERQELVTVNDPRSPYTWKWTAKYSHDLRRSPRIISFGLTKYFEQKHTVRAKHPM